MTPFDLTGKNILISGASSGIGRQCAISCGKMGATVILMGRDNARLEETLSQMDEPSKHLVCRGNLTDFDWVTQIVEAVCMKSVVRNWRDPTHHQKVKRKRISLAKSYF